MSYLTTEEAMADAAAFLTTLRAGMIAQVGAAVSRRPYFFCCSRKTRRRRGCEQMSRCRLCCVCGHPASRNKRMVRRMCGQVGRVGPVVGFGGSYGGMMAAWFRLQVRMLTCGYSFGARVEVQGCCGMVSVVSSAAPKQSLPLHPVPCIAYGLYLG